MLSSSLQRWSERPFASIVCKGRAYDVGVSPWCVWNLMVTTTENAGIEEISTHDFRRTFASHLLDTTDIATVQQMMGHKDASTTAGYDRRGARAAESAVETLESWGDE